jgi:hypothetical protein
VASSPRVKKMRCETLKPETAVMLDLKGRNPDLPRRLVEEMRRVRPGTQILVCSQN